MKKRLLILTAALLSALILFSCSKNEEDYLSLDPCGILLPITTEYMDKGLSCEAYGTDMAIYPVVIIGFSYPQAVQALYDGAREKFESLESYEEQEKFYDELQQKMAEHQKLIGELAVIPTKDYKSMKNKPVEGLEFIMDMKVIKQKYGNTYLFSSFENTTEGMSEEEAQVFLECQDYALNAIKKAKYKKVEIESYDPEKYLQAGENGGIAFPMFASVDLNGNSITEEVFKKNDMTLLVMWNVGGESEPIEALASWSERKPENVQVVGIVCDINSPTESEKIESAKKVTGNRFTNIIGAGDLATIHEVFQDLPTVLLVDKDGDLWGEPIDGASLEDCIEAVAMWEQADASIKAMEKKENEN